ncbi:MULTISPECIES: VCBS repeat-containing protein [unclassified Croceitalea]|uniref:VCBS repeat-containing protein n=1 Tax=unclassified Croceitalea TaxID=2632280 RepID=UPI0030D83C80
MKRQANETGITFKNQLTSNPELNILNYLYYYNGGGVAAGDFNNDNLVDLYFTSNQEEDRLYLNMGNLKFKDITKESKIRNAGNWTTGVTHVDINNDGLLDIYVCKVGGYKNFEGHNLLYVNQGVNEKGVPSFLEKSADYGLDFSGFSTQAAFFDYDLDGDLDVFLLNHSTHPNRTYGRGSKRKQINKKSGDKLLRNDNGKFIDVSLEAGIFQGGIGYGLGLGLSDLNNDGYTDIYIGNDFFENDYLYINQKDGTFKEIISLDNKKLGHTTHYSMGNSIADINNDGLTDIVSLDMLPEDLHTYKTSGLEYPFPEYQQYLKNGYAPQYMQNTLHLNLGNTNFSEIANLSGISATEWSWGPLLADFDNDGLKDIFISNGIKGATNDMDFINFIANDNIQKSIDDGMTEKEMGFITKIPEKKAHNYFFKNKNGISFENVTDSWFEKKGTFSNGCSYADLDNDGDLDIIVNNVNETAHILENTSSTLNKSLTIKLQGSQSNLFGIGAKIISYNGNLEQHLEHFPSRGYLSSVPNKLHFGVGKDTILDSLKVIWPDGKFQKIKKLHFSNPITLKYDDAESNFYKNLKKAQSLLIKKSDTIFLKHNEKNTIEFDRDPLVPFANTNEGPQISIADINNDSLEDIFISGAKTQPSALYVQNAEGGFESVQKTVFVPDAFSEDVSHVFFDSNNDSYKDLLVVSGGNEFKSSKRLQPRLYINKNGTFYKDTIQFKGIELNASKVAAFDFDNDGDQDIIITSDQVPWQFGKTPRQYFFENDGAGNFIDDTQKIAPELELIGQVKDVVFSDIDNNGFNDIIVVGHWMPISILLNNGKTFQKLNNNGLNNTHGFWNVVKAEDFDNDGDIDLVAGNWGKNSKFKASKEKPITLYSYDFDSNGSIEPLVTYFHKNKETPFPSKDELVKQMPFLNKKYLSYDNFASQTIDGLFGSEKLDRASQKKVYELSSMYFENDGKGNFTKKELPAMAQISTVQDIAIKDFDGDGAKDALLVGNNYEISTHLGRMDASHGTFLKLDQNKDFIWAKDWKADISGPARSIKEITIQSKTYFLVGVNNDKPILLSLEK